MSDSKIWKEIVIFGGDSGIAVTFRKSWSATSGDITSELILAGRQVDDAYAEGK